MRFCIWERVEHVRAVGEHLDALLRAQCVPGRDLRAAKAVSAGLILARYYALFLRVCE